MSRRGIPNGYWTKKRLSEAAKRLGRELKAQGREWPGIKGYRLLCKEFDWLPNEGTIFTNASYNWFKEQGGATRIPGYWPEHRLDAFMDDFGLLQPQVVMVKFGFRTQRAMLNFASRQGIHVIDNQGLVHATALARMLGIHRQTIYNWIRAEFLPARYRHGFQFVDLRDVRLIEPRLRHLGKKIPPEIREAWEPTFHHRQREAI